MNLMRSIVSLKWDDPDLGWIKSTSMVMLDSKICIQVWEEWREIVLEVGSEVSWSALGKPLL